MVGSILREILTLYFSALPILLICVFGAASLWVTRDPPILPNDISFTPDCYAISTTQMFSNSSRINITVEIGDLFEIPRTAAIRLLSLIAQSGDTITYYRYNTFMDIRVHDQSISFSIQQHIGGNINSTLTCLNHPLSSTLYTINELEYFTAGYSRIIMLPHLNAQLRDFCFSNGTIHYFTKAVSLIPPMRASLTDKIPFKAYFMNADEFENSHPQHQTIFKSTIFVTADPKEPWKQLSDVLLPMWGSLFTEEDRSKYAVYLVKNQKWMIPNIKKLISNPVMLNNSHGCFFDGHFIRSTGSIPLKFNSTTFGQTESFLLAFHFGWIMDINTRIMSKFIRLFTQQEMVPNTVVLDRLASQFKRILKQRFPECNFIDLPDIEDENNTIESIADVVASAQIFISSHISSSLFAIFMSKGSTLFEIQPLGCECMFNGHAFSQMAGVRYVPFYQNKTCEIKSLEEYFNHTEVHYDVQPQRFLGILENILIT